MKRRGKHGSGRSRSDDVDRSPPSDSEPRELEAPRLKAPQLKAPQPKAPQPEVLRVETPRPETLRIDWRGRRLSNALLVGWRDPDHAAPAIGFPVSHSMASPPAASPPASAPSSSDRRYAASVATTASGKLEGPISEGPISEGIISESNISESTVLNQGAILYEGDGHLLCLGPTGSGKGRGVAIPNLLLNDNPAVVVDIKGELAQVTARRRREMGHRVVVLDPFGVLKDAEVYEGSSDTFNPFDLFDLPDSQPDADSEMLAELIAGGKTFKDDPFWDLSARGILSGCIAHLGSAGKGDERSIVGVRKLMHHDDMDYELAKMLDNQAVTSRLARDEFVAYLSITSDRTRPCVRSTAHGYLKCLGSDAVMANLAASTWQLQDLVDGKPMTIFLVIPPDKLASHRVLLRIWVSVLLTAIMRRRRLPRQRTILYLDEAATLGALTQVETAITLMRGYGVQTYTFWQDLSQISQLYPQSWQAIVNNSSASMQVFGVSNPLMARQIAELLGISPEDVLRLKPRELLLYQTGSGLARCRRPDYLRDSVFAGLYDPNRRLESRDAPRAV